MRAGVIAILLVVAAGSLDAQSIRGRLLDDLTKKPVSGALLELRDVQGKVLTQTFTSPSGTFVFTVAPAQGYQLRFAAIGYARHATINLGVANDAVVVPDVMLVPIAITLPELRAMVGKRACGRAELNPETFGGLLESASTSLRVMDATLRSAQLGFEVQLINTHATKGANDSIISSDTTMSSMHEWPVRSLPLDSLQLFGYQRVNTPEEGPGHHYYGPDMQVLVSDWFLDTHCFTLDKDRSKGDTVVIKFDPSGKRPNVDVSGTLVLDRPTLTMRRLTFELRDLPDGLPDRSAGGEIRFAEKVEGLWLPVEWAMWAPITKAGRVISRPMLGGSRSGMSMGPPPRPVVQVVGRREQRGRLTRIVPRG